MLSWICSDAVDCFNDVAQSMDGALVVAGGSGGPRPQSWPPRPSRAPPPPFRAHAAVLGRGV